MTLRERIGGCPGRLINYRLPALWLALFLAVGIYMARNAPSLWWPLPALCVTAFLVFLIFHSRKSGKTAAEIAFCSLLAGCGFLVYSLDKQAIELESSALPEPGEEFALVGRLEGAPWRVKGFRGAELVRFRFRMQAVNRVRGRGWEMADCRVLVTAPDVEWLKEPCDERLVFIATRLESLTLYNPGGFRYNEYLESRSIAGEVEVGSPENIRRLESADTGLSGFFYPGLWASRLRAVLFEKHERLYPDKEVRAVASAMLIGAREAVPRHLNEAFISSGTIHVLVVSGLHVGFIAAAVFLLFSLFLGRGFRTAFLTVGAVFLFALVSGGRPSVVRAAVMSAFIVMALPLQRERVALNSLAAAFAVLILVRPGWLFDAAFQLSFAAVAGIIVLTPRLEERLQHKTWWQSGIYRYMAHLVLGSLAAQLAVTPVVAYYFSRITPVALLANPLMVFLAGVSVVAGFAADLAGFLFFPLARVISLLSALTMQWMIYLANLFAGLPWASFEITAPGVVDIAFFWAAAYLGTGLFTSRSRPGSLLIVGLVWINFLLWGGVIESGKDTVLLRFPDLGRKSSAAVVYLPGNATVLVSPAGKTGSVTRRVLSDCILRHSGRKIDCLILRKPGPGQIRWAWEMADRFDLGALVIEPPKKESLLYVNFLEYCKAGNVPVRMASARDTSAVHGAGIYFLPLAGSSSLIPVVERGGLRVLFAGALKTNDLKSFLDSEKSSGFDCDMLEWPLTLEGGQEDKTASGFLGNFKPGLVVSPFACGHAGRVRMMSTEEHGAVTVSFEHGVIRVSTERTGWRGVRTLRFRSCSPG